MSLDGIVADIVRRLGALERRLAWQSREGTVVEVNAGAGLARVELQDGIVTGWIPWAEISAGANKTHNPVSEGQQVKVFSESGDMHDAVIMGSLNSDANARPSADGAAHVLASIGGVTVTVSGEGLAVQGGTVTHDGKDIGKTHTHGGVLPGNADTDVPN